MRDRSYKYISGMDEDAQDGRPGCNGQEVDEAERKKAGERGEVMIPRCTSPLMK